MLKEIKVKTSKKQEIIDLTNKVKEIVADSNVDEGICIIYVPHATAGILINENYDPSVCQDIINKIEELISTKGNYKHNCIGNNAHAHLKAALIGPSETIIIKDNKLVLGTWQGIGLAEFEGPRTRSVFVKIMSDG